MSAHRMAVQTDRRSESDDLNWRHVSGGACHYVLSVVHTLSEREGINAASDCRDDMLCAFLSGGESLRKRDDEEIYRGKKRVERYCCCC
jgi:hypothetical protein